MTTMLTTTVSLAPSGDPIEIHGEAYQEYVSDFKGDPGKSAYEEWLLLGNIGSESVFIASLKGTTGIQGVQGERGLTGATGSQGERGLTGLTGEQGVKGDVGNKGDQGERGLQGIQGVAGNNGDNGYTPIKGIDYFDGAKGDKGDTGERGLTGETGLQGIQGERGLTGETGTQGMQGIQGIQGIAGVQGIQGEKGEDGLSWEAATFNTTLNFGANQRLVYATITDTSMTLTKIIQCFYTDKLDEVAILNMRVSERNRTAGVGFDIVGVAPDGASGIYPVRIITSGA